MRRIRMAMTGAAALLAAPASAALIFDLAHASGPLLSPGSISIDFKSGAGAAVADFRITGHASLDGAGNGHTDVFTLSHNGKDVFSGSFNLGGGGKDVQYFGPESGHFTALTPGKWKGGVVDVYVPLELTAGINILGFRYTGKAQGKSDEAWSLDTLKVSTRAPGAVPEPASWAMMIAGFGLVGLALRRRRVTNPGRALSA